MRALEVHLTLGLGYLVCTTYHTNTLLLITTIIVPACLLLLLLLLLLFIIRIVIVILLLLIGISFLCSVVICPTAWDEIRLDCRSKKKKAVCQYQKYTINTSGAGSVRANSFGLTCFGTTEPAPPLVFVFFLFFSARPTSPIPPIRVCICSSSNPPLQDYTHLVTGRSGSLFSRIIRGVIHGLCSKVIPRGITYLGLVLMDGLIASDPWRKKSHRNCLGQTEKYHNKQLHLFSLLCCQDWNHKWYILMGIERLLIPVLLRKLA